MRLIRPLIAVGLVLLGVVSWRVCQEVVPTAPDVLRLHVRAASDNPEDQRRKLLVRDALLEAFGRDLAACTSRDEAEQTLILLEHDMTAVAEAALAADGRAQPVTVYQGVEDFPTRDYDGATYPAGRYHVLRVDIGPAAGQNWWCVLYPPLCVTGTTPETTNETTQVIADDPAPAVEWATAKLWRRIVG